MPRSYFAFDEHGTTYRTEVMAGITTFLTMAYIIFVQPAALSGAMFGLETGIDFGAVTAATCVSAALATLIMGVYAKYPIALAPGMGLNVFFVISALPIAAAASVGEPWRVTLGAVFVAGILFLVLSVFGVREKVVDAVSPSMKQGIAVGIGLLIALIGLRNGQVVVSDPGSGIRLNPAILSPDIFVFLVGFLVASVLHARRVIGSIIGGIAAALATAVALRLALPSLAPDVAASEPLQTSLLFTQFQITNGIVSAPPSLSPTLFQMDIVGALTGAVVPVIVIFLFIDVFDTTGTLIGVGQLAGLLKGGKLERMNRAMVSDAVGTVVGACLGTSTVTSYIESAAGVEAGGRTGLTAVTVAILFLVALFFTPLVAMVGSYPPITAPALVLVGIMMMRNVTEIAWSDRCEAIPSTLVMMGIPFLFSIADGIALGMVAYPVIKSLGGRRTEVRVSTWMLAGLLVAYFVFVRSRV